MSSAEAPRLGADARQLVPAWIAFLALAVIAWAVTISQARGMDMGTGTMGLALPAFLAIWVVMMAAMMFPSVAPVAIMWVKSIRGLSSGALRAWRMTSFTAGYLLAWAAFGVFAFAVLTVVDRVLGVHPSAGRWIGAGVFARGRRLPADSPEGRVPSPLPLPHRAAAPLRGLPGSRQGFCAWAATTACSASGAAGGS